jgi:hypothetical protein
MIDPFGLGSEWTNGVGGVSSLFHSGYSSSFACSAASMEYRASAQYQGDLMQYQYDRLSPGMQTVVEGASVAAMLFNIVAVAVDAEELLAPLSELSSLSSVSGVSGVTKAPSTALSTFRYTAEGETFIRYQSSNSAFTKITPSGGVMPGTFAAPASDGIIPLEQRVSTYNLPSPEISRPNVIILQPPKGTPIIGPRPVEGGPGNEVVFPFGY